MEKCGSCQDDAAIRNDVITLKRLDAHGSSKCRF